MSPPRSEAENQPALRAACRGRPKHTDAPPTQGRDHPTFGGTWDLYGEAHRRGQEFQQKLIVHKDPSSTWSETDIRAQVEMSLALRENLNELVDMIEQIEWIRKQTNDLIALLGEDEGVAEVVSAAEDLNEKLIAVEENLFQMKRTPGGDTYRWKTMLYGRILSLARDLESTNWSAGTDAPPTTQQVEVHELLKTRLATYKSRLNEILERDIPAFNGKLVERNYPTTLCQVAWNFIIGTTARSLGQCNFNALFPRGGIMSTRSKLFPLSLLVFVAAGVWAVAFTSWSLQADGPAPGNDSILKEEMKADLIFLSSDTFKGRIPETTENELSAEFIRSRFERLGLKPAGPNGSYYQPYNMMRASLGEDNMLEVKQGDDACIRLRPGQDYYPHRFSASGQVRGPAGLRGIWHHRAQARLR